MSIARRAAISAVVMIVCGAARVHADALPGWARALRPPAAAPGRAGAVILHDEIVATVLGPGRVRTERRYAAWIASADGRDAASIAELYSTDGGGVKALRAWVQKPGGEVRELGSRESLDVALVNNDVYNEARVRTITAGVMADAGALFVAESVVDERVPFSQFEWPVQGRWPAVLIRRVLALPDGWRASAITLNGASLDPRIAGSTYTWEMHDVPAVADEPLAPPVTATATRLVVSYFGATPAPGEFESWADVTRWLRFVTSSADTTDETLAARARALTAGAATELEKIQAIARYVQAVQYISIQTGIGRGGGYRPHPPRTVFDRNYGDCKDKANLMRTMLAAIGIRAYLVAIYAGDPTYVRAAWHSPQQFNHCIIAIAIDAATDAGSVVQHATLGRLLIFDPTDETTNVGDLPEHEQGSLALIVADGEGDLTRMPKAAPTASLVDRQFTAVVSDAVLTARLEQRSIGSAAARERMLLRVQGAAAAERSIQEAFSASLGGLHPGAVSISEVDRAVVVRTEISGRNYLQPLQQGLFVLRLPSLLGNDVPALSSAPRKTPVRLHPRVVVETVRLKLAPPLSIDELPESTKVDGSNLRFELAVERERDEIVLRRRLEIDGADVPLADQERLKAALTRVRAAADIAIVLKRP